MKTIFKTILPLLGAILINAACSDDDENNNIPTASVTTMSATVSGINNKVDKVLLTIDPIGTAVYGESEFKDNTFRFSLQKEVRDSYLQPLSGMVENFDKMKLSDSSAKACYGEFYAQKNGKETGYFVQTNGGLVENNNVSNSIYYIYVDRDVEMTGKQGTTTVTTASCSFKKGWNMIGQTIKTAKVETENPVIETIYTTAIPANVTWKYEEFTVPEEK